MRRSWRKLHLAVDAGTGEIAAHMLINGSDDDAAQVPLLLRGVEGTLPWSRRTAPIMAVEKGLDVLPPLDVPAPYLPAAADRQRQSPLSASIPPRASTVQSMDDPDVRSPRDSHIRLMAERGSIEWQQASGYGRRKHAETAMGRCKHLIGSSSAPGPCLATGTG